MVLAAVLLVAALAAPVRAAVTATTDPINGRESAAEVGALLRGLRGREARPEAAGVEPRRIYVVVTALTEERRAALEAAGLVIELPAPGAPAPRWPSGEVVQGRASAAAGRAIAALPFVRRIALPGAAWTNAGAVTSAGDTLLTSTAARAVLGTDGTGVSVGVISDGADHRAASIASGDLPADLELPFIPGLSSGEGDEGTALLEILHDVAPGARLLFAPVRTGAEMVTAIDALFAAGARVIVDDLVFTDEPKFEDGPVALAARRIATSGGVYVTAAGNYARSHYLAPYRPGPARNLEGTDYRALHTFAAGDFGDSLRIPAGAEVLAVLQWTDPFGHARNDFDLILARQTAGGSVVLAASVDVQDGTGDPIEAVRYRNTGGAALDAYLAIAEFSRVASPASLRLNLQLFSHVAIPQQYVVPENSVIGHAAVEEVLSVAAAGAARPGVVEDFSSHGPASIFFPVRSGRQVPRLTGIDGVETAVGRRGEFANPFFGTSAAAPHVAGCAALLLASGVAAATAVSAMLATALDLAPPGFDLVSGAGRLDCGAAARLAAGSGAAPAVGRVTAAFDPSGAVAVEASGEDADADVRGATVRLLDSDGEELARATEPLTPSGTAFMVALVLRASAAARARAVAVSASDATGLASAEVQAALACPGDASLGDALCALGDLLDDLGAVAGRRARRLERLGRSAATALSRAGEAETSGRLLRARRALKAAAARVRRIERRASGLPQDAGGAVGAEAHALSERLRTLLSGLA